MHGAVDLGKHGFFRSTLAVDHHAHFVTHVLEERIQHFLDVLVGKVVFRRCAKIRHTRRLWRAPSLLIVDGPGMNYDDRRVRRTETVGHFDDAPGVVGETPGAHVEIAVVIFDERGRFIADFFHHGLDVLGVIREEGQRILQLGQGVVVGGKRWAAVYSRMLQFCVAGSDRCSKQLHQGESDARSDSGETYLSLVPTLRLGMPVPTDQAGSLSYVHARK